VKVFAPLKILKATAFWMGVAVLSFGWAPAEAAFQVPLKNSCIDCHRDLANERLSRPVILWAASVHGEVGNTCDGCHGGDPNDPTEKAMSDGKQFYLGPQEEEVTGFCGKCHQELSEYFKESAHWATGMQNCIQCHGTHTVQRISLEIIDPEKCGACHEYESADKLKTVLLDLHDRFHNSQEKLKAIRGLPTQPLEEELDQVWNQLRQVRMVSHTFDMTRVEKKAEEVRALMIPVDVEIARLEGMGRDRTILGWALVALFSALSMATFLYNRTEKK